MDNKYKKELVGRITSIKNYELYKKIFVIFKKKDVSKVTTVMVFF